MSLSPSACHRPSRGFPIYPDMYLLDTNVVSELRKASTGKANPGVVIWAQEQLMQTLYLSVITLSEIEAGILRLETRDPVQARVLRSWFTSRVLRLFRDRILPIDQGVAAKCAQIISQQSRSSWDALIAATALQHNLVVVTRNTRDFAGMGVSYHNPWESISPAGVRGS